MRDVSTLDSFPAETGGLSEVSNFTIQADAAMFRILIDGLYSDKPRAILRELMTNARDSHAEAGILDRPFKLQLPTRWDNTLSVRDYGVSLTHEQVMHLVTTVGLSTKKDSNVGVGKFGLGFKSPFAYTDSFSISVILDGEKRIYNAMMDSGMPRMALLVSDPTDEEQGVEISFPVRQEDHLAFVEAAKRVLLGFDVIPVNNADLDKVELETLFEGNGWKVVSRDYNNAVHGAFVRQGCVLYPVDKAALQNSRPCKALEILSNEAIVLDMPIGSVDITPSRESLSYDARTVTNLLDKLDSILDEVAAKLQETVTNAPSYWAAIRARNTLIQSIQSNQLRNYISGVTRWRGKIVTSNIRLTHDMMKVLRRHGVHMHMAISDRVRRRSHSNYRLVEDTSQKFSIENMPAFVYIEPGEEVKYLSHRLRAVREIVGDAVILRDFVPGSKAETYLNAALQRPDVPLNFIKLTDMAFDKPEYEKTLASLSFYDDYTSKFKSGQLVNNGPIYYVHTFKGQVRRGAAEPGNRNIMNVWENLVKYGLLPTNAQLVGIPASRKDLAKSIPEEWEDFFEVAEEVVRDTFNPEKAAKCKSAGVFKSHNSITQQWTSILDTFERKKLFPSSSDSWWAMSTKAIKPFLQPAKDGEMHWMLHFIIPKLFSTTEAADLLKPFNEEAWEKGFTNIISDLKTVYPMVSLYLNQTHSTNYDQPVLDHLLAYVNMVDLA